jgi:site-specific DNA recombinase
MDSVRQAILRVIIYARVSTDEQATNYSLDSQIEACRKYAERLGFIVVTEFREDFTGTVPLEQRPEGKKAYAMLRSGEADALIIYTVDRLVRPPEEGDEWDMPVLVRNLAKLGKEIHAVNRGKLDTSFAGLLIAMLDAKTAGEERRKIIERTTRGRNSKAKAGKVVGVGRPPYGYRFMRDANNKVVGLEVYKEEAGIVRLIFRWYTRDGLKLIAIARKLTEMGITAPGARYGRPRRHGPVVWDRSTLWRLLTNEAYAGTLHWGKSIGHAGEVGKRPIEEQVLVSVPPIVDRETWELAQAQIEQNRQMSQRNARHPYPLRGHITCGACGAAIVGSFNNGYRYYRCGRRDHYQPCGKGLANADGLETRVWNYLAEITQNREDFEQLLREAKEREEAQIEPKREELSVLLEQIAETEKEVNELTDDLRRLKKDGPSHTRQLHNIEQAEALYAAQCRKRDELQAEIDARAMTDANIETALQYRERFNRGLTPPEPEDIAEACAIFRVQVTVKDGKAHVKCFIPGDGKVIDLHTSKGSFSHKSLKSREVVQTSQVHILEHKFDGGYFITNHSVAKTQVKVPPRLPG